jgi:hypothetical protein
MDLKNQFKLACLSYQPSPVEYRDNTFDRQAMMKLLNIISDETIQLQSTSINRLSDDLHDRIVNRAVSEAKEWQVV